MHICASRWAVGMRVHIYISIAPRGLSARTNQPLPQTTQRVKDLSIKEYSCTPTEKEAVRELKKLRFHYNLSTHVRKILNCFSTFSSTFWHVPVLPPRKRSRTLYTLTSQMSLLMIVRLYSKFSLVLSHNTEKFMEFQNICLWLVTQRHTTIWLSWSACMDRNYHGYCPCQETGIF